MSSRTYLLALGAFAVGTSGYIVSGVLPAVSRDLHVSTAAAGQLITAFAIAYAIASPLLAGATGTWERRRLLVAALGVNALGNALAMIAPNYTFLLVSRVVSALGAAVYTPAATVVATVLNPPERRGRAVAMVFGGLTFALIIGVPAGNLIGGVIGYKGVFGLVALASVLAAAAVHVGVPRVSAPPAVKLRERFATAADKRVQMVLGMTVLACLSAFSVFTYVSSLLSATADIHGSTVSLMLLAYGIGGAFGNSISGRVTDRYGSKAPLLIILTAYTILLATLGLSASTAVGAAAALFVWGVFTWSVNPPIQNWLIELAPTNSGLLLSLNASAIYLGAGLSGIFGGLVITTVGVLALPPIAAIVAAIALVLMVLASRPTRTEPKEELAALLSPE